MCEKAFSHGSYNSEFQTLEMCKKAFDDDINNFVYFSSHLVTKEMAEKYILQFGYIPKNVVDSLITSSMALRYFEHDLNNIKYILPEDIILEIVNKALYWDINHIKCIPYSIIPEKAQYCVSKNNENIRFVPESFDLEDELKDLRIICF